MRQRDEVMGMMPDLTVVIPSVNGWGDLEGCLAALDAQEGDLELEVIVADRVGGPVRERLTESAENVRVLEAPAGTTIPELRAMAFAAARAPIVGVIEDHVIVPPDWGRAMLQAHAVGELVVGGSVDNAARQRLVEWATFLCEYAHCLAPPAGAAEWLTGNNITYRRDLLERHRAVVEEGRWENRLHDALRESGVTLHCRPEICVGHKKHFTFGEYLSQRYLYARSYAGKRVEGRSPLARLGYALAALALPPLLGIRIFSGVWGTGRYRGLLVASLPMIAIFVTAWAAGEAVGAAAGPGDALSRVR
jgi:hypothetical protein